MRSNRGGRRSPMRSGAGRRAALALTAGGLAISSLLVCTSSASAKVGDLYEDADVPAVMDAMLQLPAEMKLDRAPDPASVDVTTPQDQRIGSTLDRFPKDKVLSEVPQHFDGVANVDFRVSGDNKKEATNAARSVDKGWKVGFIGALDEGYPSISMTDAMTGEANRTFTTSYSIAHTETRSSGWSVGGNVSAGISADGTSGKVGGNFGYSEMTTKSTTTTDQSTDAKTEHIPAKATGWLEAYANGGWYAGWIVDQDPKHPEVVHAVPARVFYKSDKVGPPVSWLQRGKALPLK
ncbi:hypothetical protein [Streptomyces solincola]|nr:hypothetical protein [Streptomyces solincola]